MEAKWEQNYTFQVDACLAQQKENITHFEVVAKEGCFTLCHADPQVVLANQPCASDINYIYYTQHIQQLGGLILVLQQWLVLQMMC